MQIPCFMLSWIVIPSWWILSNHLDFSKCNFVTKLPNPESLKLPTINCFPMSELWLRKLFHWQFVFTKIWYNQKQPTKARPKIWSCCDEIMLRDEITGLDGIYVRLHIISPALTGGYTGKAKSCIGAWVPTVSIHKALCFKKFFC